ncbi:ABC transporter permease [Roseivirga misakiensis]|uniref:ABC3 transporter permease protein domain-containing protein n=1 Tax=Roseivirga misakiensis TaxID=1563681 RepID=A0A1E5T0C3_9BACT|nr:ABC transporter permease [Roseivirga misakiensis]OEK04757.1 hypothetical protein BFP71_15030 [Roseivirga misakiensis]
MKLSLHYLQCTFKNFKRNKLYSVLMIFSLAAGMFCFLLAAIYMKYEFSRNSNHKDADKIYQLSLNFGEEGRHIYMPIDFAEKLTEWNPNIEAVSTLDRGKEEYLSVDNESYIKVDLALYGEPGFFEVFTFPLLYGYEKTALSNTKDVIISSRLAELLYPKVNPVGKSLLVHKKGTFQIAGVLAPVSNQSLLKPELIFSKEQRYLERPRTLKSNVFFTHIRLKEPENVVDLENALYTEYKRLYDREDVTGVYAENLLDAYWGYSHYDYGAQYSALIENDKAMIKNVGYVAFAVLSCALIGYLSMALSLSLKRTKEIGVRKVNGANKSDIKKQLLLESIAYAYLALLITLIGLELSSDYFSNLFQVPINVDLTNLEFIIPVLGFTLLAGVLAGVYPAFIVSRLNPVAILSGLRAPVVGGFTLKRMLLIGQFAITSILVFGVLIQRLQVQELTSFDIGLNKQSLLSFAIDNEPMQQNYQSVLADIESIDEIEQISGGPFPYNFDGFSSLRFVNGDTLIEESLARVYVADNFFETLDVTLVSGIDFNPSNNIPIDKSCVVNETTVKSIPGLELGSRIELDGNPLTIIGIAKDYSDWGVSSPEAEPRVFLTNSGIPKFGSFLLKTEKGSEAKVMADLQNVWRKYDSVTSPLIQDLGAEEDETIIDLKKVSQLYGFLAVAVLILSLLNLLGVTIAFGDAQRKSISIRKVLGAKTIGLFNQLASPFISALLLGLLVGLPIAYWLMKSYLNEFAIRMEMNLWHGLAISSALMVIIFLVIARQVLQVSRINPVETLKEQ